MNRQEFYDRIRELKEKNNITPSFTKITDAAKRRISILVNDLFLRTNGSVEQGMFLERELFDELDAERLECDEIPCEVRSKGFKHKNFNPLRIHFSERQHKERSEFVNSIIKILTEEKDNEDKIRENESTGNIRKCIR